MIKTSQPFPPGAFDTLDAFLAMVDQLGPGGFGELASLEAMGDGATVDQDSRVWAARFLRGPANPYQATPPARRTAHFASQYGVDLLRHELRVGELGLTVVESVRALLVTVAVPDGLQLGAGDQALAQTIAELAEPILAMEGTHVDPAGQSAKYQWALLYEPPIRDGSRFSTAPQAEPRLLPSYAARLDGGIHRAAPFFFGYKARPSGDGRLVFLDARHWFDGKCWEPYERSPRRA